MNKTLKVYLVLEHKNSQVYKFASEFVRLTEQKDSFLIGWKAGERIYINDCNGRRRKNIFACLAPSKLADNKNAVSTINYAISLNCKFDINITEKELIFLISSDDEKKITFIEKFKKGLFNLQNF